MFKTKSFFYASILLLYALFIPNLVKAKVWDAYAIVEHPAKNICSLTFDDGPSNLTPQFLDALKEEGVRVTFFVLGMQAARYPKIIKRMVAEGHEVANHSYAHSNLNTLTYDDIYADLKKANKVLQKAGVKARLLRPPYGKYNKNVIAIANQLGMELMLWSVDSRDWEGKPDYGNMPNILNRPMSAEEMRGIFLFHDTKIRTVQDIKLIIMILRAVGCTHFVTASEYVEDNIERKLFDNSPLIIPRPDLKNPERYNAKELDFNWDIMGLGQTVPASTVQKTNKESKLLPDNFEHIFSPFTMSLEKK